KFLFSSRRRHTGFSRDWSSDVCSSDLLDRLGGPVPRPRLDTGRLLRGGGRGRRPPGDRAGHPAGGAGAGLGGGAVHLALVRGPTSEERRLGKERLACW